MPTIMKRLATLLIVAGITLVGYTGAVYSVLSQDMPDNTSEPVYSAVEAQEVESIDDTVEVEAPIVEQAPVARTAPEEKTEEPVEDQSGWRKFLDEQNLKGGAYAEAVDCIYNWGKYNNAAKAHEISYIYNNFYILSATEKDSVVEQVFEKVRAERTCAPRWIPG